MVESYEILFIFLSLLFFVFWLLSILNETLASSYILPIRRKAGVELGINLLKNNCESKIVLLRKLKNLNFKTRSIT